MSFRQTVDLGIWHGVFCGLLVYAWSTSPSCAGEPFERQVYFHIDGGPLEAALLQFSRQANVPITLAPHATRDLLTTGVQGRLSVGSALATLLRDSGLSYAVIGETVTITRTSATRNAFDVIEHN